MNYCENMNTFKEEEYGLWQKRCREEEGDAYV